MNFRTTTIMFGLLMAMLFVFGIVIEIRQSALDEGYLFGSLHQGDTKTTLEVDKIKWKKDGDDYTMVKSDDGWTMKMGQEQWRLDTTKINSIITQVQDVRKDEQVDVIHDMGKAQLSPAKMVVTLVAKGTGKEYTLYLGKKSADDAKVFVKSSERSREVTPVAVQDIEDLYKEWNELRDVQLLRTDTAATRVLEITKGKDKKKLVVQRGDDSQWRFEAPDALKGEVAADVRTGDDKDLPYVSQLLDTIHGLNVASAKHFENRGNAPLANYGVVEGEETLRIEIKTDKDKTEVLWIGNNIEPGKGKKTTKPYYYARLDVDDNDKDDYVVRIDEDKIKPILDAVNDPKTLRSRDVGFFTANDVDAVDIYSGKDLKEVVKLTKTAEPVWRMFANSKNMDANTDAISGDKGLLPALVGKGKIQEFKDKASEDDLGLKDPRAKVEIYIGGADPTKDDKKTKEPARKKGAPKITFVFGKTVKKNIYVERILDNGNKSRFAVPVELYKNVFPASEPFYLAYLKTELPAFDVAMADKIELKRGNEPEFVIQLKAKEKKKDKKDDKKDKLPLDLEKEDEWVMLSPKDLPSGGTDQSQVDEVLNQLSKIQVNRWVKKLSGKGDDLSKYGLKTPSVRLTITLKPEPEPPAKKDKKDKDNKDKDKKDQTAKKTAVPKSRTYEFGTMIKDDKLGELVYVHISAKDIVFLADADVARFLKEVELRDRTIYTADTDKVLEIHFKWRGRDKDGKVKYIHELDVKRDSENDEWKATKTSGFEDFKLEPFKVSDILTHLGKVQAKRYLHFKGGPSVEHKLDKAALEITLLRKGKKDIRLNVGAETKEQTGYFAQSPSELAGAVFIVERLPFTDLLKGSSYFNARVP